MSSATAVPRATLSDLMKVDCKAELVNGKVVEMGTGFWPGRVSFRITVLLDQYATQVGRGVAIPDNVIFAIPENPEGRESFSPDASCFTGALPANRMRPIDGVPVFAAEVRSENDYGPAAERAMAAKRAEYFAAGTLVVWDVDPKAGTVTKHRPGEVVLFAAGSEADAEPAVPGWRVAFAALFA